MKRMKKGFTLAEVLITLAIIGIVAALTIPTLMTDSRYQLVSSRIAKFVSVTEDAALAQAAMNGTIDAESLDGIILYKQMSGTKTKKKDPETGEDVEITTLPNTYQLKDGTSLIVANISGSHGINTDIADNVKYGAATALLTFSHKVSGLNNVRSSLDFVMTDKGYIFPDKEDTCSSKLFDTTNGSKNPWKLTKTIADSECSNKKTP